MKDFIYDIWTKVYFGPNQLNNLAKELKQYGSNVFLLYGSQRIKNSDLYKRVIDILKSSNIEITEFSSIKPNPRHTDIQKARELCVNNKCTVILAIGGGSVMDSAKVLATAALLNEPIWDIVLGKVENKGSLPLIVIPTLSATGSEMNYGAVISNLETKEKISYRIPSQRPRVAFLNPELVMSVPKYQTACGSVDILCHNIESYFSSNDAMYFMDTIMHGIARTVLKYAPIAYNEPDNYDARANLMWASPWAINELVRADKELGWTIHMIEHEFSAFYDITHGLGLAIIMPKVLRHWIDQKSLPRFRTLGIYGFDIDSKYSDIEIANKVIEKIEEFSYNQMNLQSRFSEIGITDEHFDEMLDRLINKNNIFPNTFREFSREELREILYECL